MTPEPSAAHSPEPGAKHDNLSHFGFGPGVTPVEDLTTSVFFIAGSAYAGYMALSNPGVPGWATALVWFCSLMFVAGTVYTTQRGIRRWRWRLANVHLTGGVYLRPWEKTPRSTR